MKNLAFSTTLIMLFTIHVITAKSQTWAIRGEGMLTSTKAKEKEASTSIQPFVPTFYNRPDVALTADYYTAGKSRWSLSIATYSAGFAYTAIPNKGGLGKSAFWTQSTRGGINIAASYGHNVLPVEAKTKLFIGGGINLFGARNFSTQKVGLQGINEVLKIDSFNTQTTHSVLPGLHASISYWIGNKKGREVLQLFMRYNQGLGKSLVENKIVYDARNSNNGQQLDDEIVRFGWNGTSIQIGLSKNIFYFDRSRNKD